MSVTARQISDTLTWVSELEIKDQDGELLTMSATINLFYVWANENGVKLKALKAFTRTSGANITGVVDRWVRLGYATRKEDTQDRRSYIVKVKPMIAKQFAEEFERVFGGAESAAA